MMKSMLVRAAAVLVAALAVSACSGQVGAIQAEILDRGSAVNDQAVERSITGLCRVYSVGAIERRFMRSPEDWELWNRLCRPGREVLPMPALESTVPPS